MGLVGSLVGRGGVGRRPRWSRGGVGRRPRRSRGGVSRRPRVAPSSRTVEVTGSWKKEDNNPINISYHGIPGPVCNLLNPVSTFAFTAQVWDLLVSETNAYAARIMPSNWNDTCEQEMKAFLGILILMSMCKLPSIHMYWSTKNEDLAPEIIRRVMPRDRFKEILSCLHTNAVDPSLVTCVPTYDRLYKVRKVLDLVLPKFESSYTTHKELSMVEAMIKFKGRLVFNQYMKDKPTKWDIKVFVLSDARNGYVYRLQVYTGKNQVINDGIGLCSRVVLDLLDGLDNTGVTCYMDRFYSSPNLFLTLAIKGIR